MTESSGGGNGTGFHNRLAKEGSPYLRQHAKNPVDWYPWGPEALERAKKEGRPILLSVGYSACHWCHVMAHESFEHPETAELMNRFFVNVKVDREERPDVDQLYQGVVQLMGRSGGWPLTVFLTPDLRPFFGGTYFPPTDRHGLPSFQKVLHALNEAWTGARDKVEEQANGFRAGLAQLATYGLDTAPEDLVADDIVSGARKLESVVDRPLGGFGDAPKFPNPMNVAVLLRGARRLGEVADDRVSSAALLTLRRMAEGGIYDQLGGGFHRYSVDAHWRVPHFEKMLYDNAQLMHLYAEAQLYAPDRLWRKVVEETAEYIQRELTAPEGGFFTAQDADSEGEEGRFFAWTPDEIYAALPTELAELAVRHFGLTAEGNFEDGKSVLEVKVPPEQLARDLGRPEAEVQARLADLRGKLFAVREKRVKPGLDDKVLTGWNGLMIRGLAFAGRVFDRPEWIGWAVRAADFLLEKMRRPDGGLWRVFHGGQAKVGGFLEDYGDLASGLVALYQATFEPRFLEAADALARLGAERFFDSERSAYWSAPRGRGELPVATYALFDNAFPSGAATLTEAQVALAAMTGDASHLTQAERYLRQMRPELVENPLGYGHLLLAGDAFADGAPSVVVVGSPADRGPLIAAQRRVFAPTVSWVAVDPIQPPPALLTAIAEGKTRVDGKAAAYVCRGSTCELPVTDAEALVERLRRVT